MRSRVLKAVLIIVLVTLCVVLPIVILLRQTSSPETENTEDDVTVSWTSPTTRGLWSVFMVSADDGWAVGEQGAIIHWNGTNWNNVTNPAKYSADPTLNSVYMVSADNGWAVGEHGTIIRWNGTSWNSVTSPTGHWLHSVFMVSADDGWAVGTGPGPGVIIHWNGTTWNNVTSPLTFWNSKLHSVYIVSADDGWTVGGWGTIQRWTGTEWIPEFSAATLMLILISLTLAAVMLEKTTLKK